MKFEIVISILFLSSALGQNENCTQLAYDLGFQYPTVNEGSTVNTVVVEAPKDQITGMHNVVTLYLPRFAGQFQFCV